MISNLINGSESKTLEFKRNLSSPRSVLRTLVAFANSAGGHLILGVADDRKIIGVEGPLDEEDRLSNLIADSISPRLVPSIEMITVEEKTLLVVEVFLSGMRPHSLKAEGQQSGTYVRLGSTNRLADPQLIAELQRGVAGVSFDALPMPELTLDALDLKAIAKDFEGRNSIDERTLQSLRIMVKEQGSLFPSGLARARKATFPNCGPSGSRCRRYGRPGSCRTGGRRHSTRHRCSSRHRDRGGRRY